MSAGADIMCRLMKLIFCLFDNNSWMLSFNNNFKLWTAWVSFTPLLFVCCSSTKTAHFTQIIQRNKTCLYSDKELGFEDQEGLNSPREQEKTLRPGLMRSTSREISRIPLQVAKIGGKSKWPCLQEAMKNGNAQNYFNALRRLDFRNLVRSMSRLMVEHLE